MRIAIRADGGSKIGMGHIMRTLVLAKELAKTNDVFYVCKDDAEFAGGIEKVQQEGFNVVRIKADNANEETLNVEADILITDSYNIDEEYFNLTKDYFTKTVYVDDLNCRNYKVDVLINQNIGAEKWEYSTSEQCKKLLGTQYILLREEFRQEEPILIKEESKNVLITMGGADPLEATNKLLDMIKGLDFTFHIVIGKNFRNKEVFKSMENTSENLIFYYDPVMIDVMLKCDMAIAACGSTIYELSALGIPTLGVIVADNQEKIAEIGNQEHILINLGHINNLSKELLLSSVENLSKYETRKIIQSNQLKKINKNGVLNIVREIQS